MTSIPKNRHKRDFTVDQLFRVQERKQVLAVTSVALFFSVLVWFNYSAVLPLIVEEWELSGVEAGIIFGAFQAGYLVAILPVGRLADRYSPRWVIAVGATGTGIPSLAFAVLADGFLLGQYCDSSRDCSSLVSTYRECGSSATGFLKRCVVGRWASM